MASLEIVRDRFIRAQLAGDRREAARLVEEALCDGAAVWQVREEVICAGQREVGRLWAEGRIGSGTEHTATAVAQVALASLHQLAQPEPQRDGLVLVSCVPGEQHDFPARVFADALELDGYRVRFLGTDVPLSTLLATIREANPDVLALSAMVDFHVEALRATVTAVREQFPELPILLGGAACESNRAVMAELGDDCGSTASEGVRLVQRHIEGSR